MEKPDKQESRELRRVLSFHVRQFLCDLSAANREDVHTPQMPWLAISDLSVNPTDGGASATDDDFLGLESGIGILLKPRTAESHDIGFFFDAFSTRGRRGALENRIISQKLSQR